MEADHGLSAKILQVLTIEFMNTETRGLFWSNLYRTSGSSNVMGIMDGRAVAIQVRSQRGRKNLVQSQLTFSENFRQAGGQYYVISSMEDLQELAAIHSWHREKESLDGLQILGHSPHATSRNRKMP